MSELCFGSMPATHRPSAADEIHEQCFGLIAHMMPESESIEPILFPQFFEESIAKFP